MRQYTFEIATDRIAWAQQAAATFIAIATCLIGPHLARRRAARQAVHLTATGFSDATHAVLACSPHAKQQKPHTSTRGTIRLCLAMGCLATPSNSSRSS